jgi:chromosome segregation ATPase
MKPDKKDSHYEKAIELCQQLCFNSEINDRKLRDMVQQLSKEIKALNEEKEHYYYAYLEVSDKLTAMKDRAKEAIWRMLGLDEED